MLTKKRNIFEKLAPILFVLVIGLAFGFGALWQKVNALERGVLSTKTTGAAVNPQAAVPQQPTKGVAAIDDDPVIGDKNAPVTIIEFSDYECPFCKRYFDETFPQLKQKYVDTGKVKIVFRDLPLSFHDPMATKEAVAANCARKQGGDTKYFEYHDEIFKRTKSNGNGLSDTDLTTIATSLSLNISSFNSCLTDPTQTDEVKKDLADATKAGASGTPTFIVGKSTGSGEISGDLVVGAQPFAAFQAVIDPLLQ